MSEKIEFEEVTVKVPKRVMDYLRAMEPAYECSPVEWLEYCLLDGVRSDLESRSGIDFMKMWDLESVFKTLLNC